MSDCVYKNDEAIFFYSSVDRQPVSALIFRLFSMTLKWLRYLEFREFCSVADNKNVNKFVYMYIYYIYMYTCECICTHLYICMRIHIYIYGCICMYHRLYTLYDMYTTSVKEFHIHLLNNLLRERSTQGSTYKIVD